MNKKIFLIGGVVLTLVIIIFIVMLNLCDAKRDYIEYIEVSQKYVDELDYEKAIAELEMAIEIEPNSAKAYLALANVYIQMDEYDTAISVLEGAKGKVKDMTEIENLLIELEKKITEPVYIYYEDGSYSENIYDSNGKLVRVVYYSPEGIETGYHEHEYDENGNEIRVTPYSVDGTISGVYETREYDDIGRVIKKYTYWASGVIWAETTYEYFENGKSEKQVICSEGVPYMYTITEYDNYGKKLKTSYYDMDGTFNSYIVPEEFDVYGNVLKESFYNADGSFGGYTEFKYDENGYYISQRFFDANGNVLMYN